MIDFFKRCSLWLCRFFFAFCNWRTIEEQLNCNVYFADPYCAWQKGTNENLNGLLREFYPKGRNLSRVSPTTLKKNLALINARPK
ncbi:MAG: IS30 family transposase, partial [Clostridia bacterium]|nr:IS30 family transposase [Clostridia bacterium]